MQFVAAREAREGMCVAADIRDKQGRILIARGQRLSDYLIARLRKFGVESIFIDPRQGESPVRPTKSELREQCVKVLGASFSNLTPELSARRIALDTQAIQEVTTHLIEALLRSKDPLVTLLDISTDSDRLLQHAVNATVLATVIAIDLHVPQAMLYDLAVAMLFHDIGMIFLPESLTQKTGTLTGQEILTLRQHPQLGYEHLMRTGAVSPVAANIVLRHHEHMDGSGYPQNVGADKLSPLIRIACAVEVYDSLTTRRFGTHTVLPDVALSYIIRNAGTLYAKEVVIALCQRLALYPNGIAVQLNTGEMGIVAGTLPKAPTRPVVLLHSDNRGKPLKTPMIVDLMSDHDRAVLRSAPDMEQLIQAKEANHPLEPVDPIYATLG